MNNGTIPASRKQSSAAALVPKTMALLILLYQIRFLASDLIDTVFFITALAGAIVLSVFLYKVKIFGKRLRPMRAFLILVLVPWVIRFFIAVPRWFVTGGPDEAAIFLDSLLLNFDRNNFFALLPFYWVALGTYFSLKSRRFLRADIIAADTFFLVLFSAAPAASLDVYVWPVLVIGIFAFVIFLQILSLVLSSPPELKYSVKEKFTAGIFVFLFVFTIAAFFVRPFQEKAVENSGGLLEPNLFRFDFSQVLRLESEIHLKDDLVMIVKKEAGDAHFLLRRYTISGYGGKQGFFRLEDIDEAAHPQRLPDRRTELSREAPYGEISDFRVTNQEYYIVNFDAQAFIGMNMPVEIVPYETWDISSFNSAYAVTSHTSEALPFELIGAVRGGVSPDGLGLSGEDYALYTDYGQDEEIAAFARKIIENYSSYQSKTGQPLSYWAQIQAVYDTLKNGDYRYSLKPGIAPDGDQLKYFLFDVKKGYCSYYAFAFAMLLRSLGIPCRVAAGFVLLPSTDKFNYYPVREDMAHAWVEVWFPKYGWIEYDPTSTQIADGEEFSLSAGTPQELFERLMKEILDNYSNLREKEGSDTEAEKGGLAEFGRNTVRLIARSGPFFAAAFVVLFFILMRSGFLLLSFLSGNPRKKTRCLWLNAKRRLRLAGYWKEMNVVEAERAKSLDSFFDGLYLLYLDNAASRFAPSFTEAGKLSAAEHYRLFDMSCKKNLPLRRRILSWLLPPVALALGASGHPGKKKNIRAGILLLIAAVFLFHGERSGAQEDLAHNADRLYEDALTAQSAENWERAIMLFSEGEKEFPDDPRFPRTLGNLYYYRELYHLAWDEYRRSETITPYDPELLLRLANTAGYLNMNEISADYLERVLVFEPANMEAAGTLAWMYFKLHRLEEGEKLLLETMELMGQNFDYSMTLGTVYAAMFRYDESKEYYLRAIAGAESTGDKLLAALAHYNLSILESRFYRYGEAYARTNSSLAVMNSAYGRLARGELYLRRMELPDAVSDYQEGFGMDNSPLSKLNLAEAFLTSGRLDEALLYAEDCLKADNNYWMLNYGIDPVSYKRDTHEILADIYEGLYNAEQFSAPSGFAESVKSFFKSVSYKFRFEIHRHLYRKYSLLAADAYVKGSKSRGAGTVEIHVEALINYFNAFEGYPQRAFSYLEQARLFEEPLIPESSPSYDFEEGRLFGNRNLVEGTLAEFDPVWERDMIAEVYAEMALTGKEAERSDAAERLFAINRGALPGNGIRLPVSLRFDASLSETEKNFASALTDAGFEDGNRAGIRSPRYTLTIGPAGEGKVFCELYDGGRGTSVFSGEIPLASPSSHDITAFAGALRDRVFSPF